MRLDMPFEDFIPVYGGPEQFRKDLSASLGIAKENVEVVDFWEGSVIIAYNLVENAANDKTY